MNKIMLLSLFIFSAQHTFAASVSKLNWPPYIDNSACLKGASKCHFNTGWNDGTIWFDNISSITQQYLGSAGSSQYNGTGYKANIKFKYVGLPQTPQPGKPMLLAAAGNYQDATTYKLSGLENEEMTVQWQYVEWNKDWTSHGETKYYYDKFTVSQVMTGVSLGRHFDSNQQVTGYSIWYDSLDYNNFYLISGDRPQVRTLQLPGIRGELTLIPDKNEYKGYTDRGLQFLPIQYVRLNHRECEIKVDSNTVNFGEVIIPPDKTGVVSNEIATQIKLSCNGYNETLWWGSLENQNKNYQINGEGVFHTVTNLHLTPTYLTTTDSSVKKIGLQLEGNDGNGQKIPKNFYVEGSLVEKAQCGQNALNVDGHTNNLPEFGDTVSDFNDKDYSKIYWKLCKEPGGLQGGKYKGSVTIKLEYR